MRIHQITTPLLAVCLGLGLATSAGAQSVGGGGGSVGGGSVGGGSIGGGSGGIGGGGIGGGVGSGSTTGSFGTGSGIGGSSGSGIGSSGIGTGTDTGIGGSGSSSTIGSGIDAGMNSDASGSTTIQRATEGSSNVGTLNAGEFSRSGNAGTSSVTGIGESEGGLTSNTVSGAGGTYSYTPGAGSDADYRIPSPPVGIDLGAILAGLRNTPSATPKPNGD